MVTEDKLNILLVDDQPGKLLSYETILGGMDENILKASSGREALEYLLKNDIAVMLIDVCMPDLDGFELQRIVSQRRSDLPVILITGRHEIAEQPQAALKWFFRKPFDAQGLLAAVAEALHNQEGEDET